MESLAPPTRPTPSSSTSERPAGAFLLGALVAGSGIFVIVQVAAAVAPGTFGVASVAVAVALFLLGSALTIVAVTLGALRAGAGEAVDIFGLFFLSGSAAPGVRVGFYAVAAMVTLVALITAVWAPFGLLATVFPVGLAGLWSARHGRFTEGA